MFEQVDWIDLEQLHYIHEDVNSDVTPKSLKFNMVAFQPIGVIKKK